MLNSEYIPILDANNKCGLIDTNGNMIIPFMYDTIDVMDSVFRRQDVLYYE